MIRFNLLKTIRNLLRGNKMSYEFVNIDVAKVEDKIKLKATAISDGKNNLPRPTSETYSNCESEAIVLENIEITNCQSCRLFKLHKR